MSRRRWIAAALVAFAAALIALVLVRRKPAPPPVAAAPAPSAAIVRAWQPPDAPRAVAAAPVPGVTSAGFIRDVLIDADEVCPNEPMTLGVLAFDARPEPRPLHVTINGDPGATRVLSFASPSEYPVVVRVDDDRGATDQRELKVRVRDCGEGTKLVLIDVEPLTKPDSYAFTARALFPRPECRRAGGAIDPKCAAKLPDGEKLHFAWEFGDGVRYEGKRSSVEHDYSRRPQEEASSSFVVKVHLTTKEHGELHGVTAVTMPNTAYTNKINAHTITPLVRVASITHVQGGHDFALDVYNYERVPLTLKTLDVEMYDCAAADRPPVHYTLRANQIFSDVNVPAGAGKLAGSLRGSLAADSYCRAVVTAHGAAPDGFPVTIIFGVPYKELSVAKPLDGSQPQDKEQIARLQKAMRLLHRDPSSGSISEDEIRKLERSGRLK